MPWPKGRKQTPEHTAKIAAANRASGRFKGARNPNYTDGRRQTCPVCHKVCGTGENVARHLRYWHTQEPDSPAPG